MLILGKQYAPNSEVRLPESTKLNIVVFFDTSYIALETTLYSSEFRRVTRLLSMVLMNISVLPSEKDNFFSTSFQ